jgi:hypothetical protein
MAERKHAQSATFGSDGNPVIDSVPNAAAIAAQDALLNKTFRNRIFTPAMRAAFSPSNPRGWPTLAQLARMGKQVRCYRL